MRANIAIYSNSELRYWLIFHGIIQENKRGTFFRHMVLPNSAESQTTCKLDNPIYNGAVAWPDEDANHQPYSEHTLYALVNNCKQHTCITGLGSAVYQSTPVYHCP